MADYSIKTNELKALRRAKIEQFVQMYGRGDKKLTEPHKKERIGKILGPEIEKLKGFGQNKDKGVLLVKNFKDCEDFAKYPNDPYEVKKTGKSKVFYVEIRDDGTLIMEGIHLNGKENDDKERSTWGVMSISDKHAARSEKKQFEEGILKTISDRTMAIHDNNRDLDNLFESPNIDTNEDKETQY